MPESLTFSPNQEVPRDTLWDRIKHLWEAFSSKDTFTKTSLIVMTLILLVTPAIIAQQTNLFSHAGTSLFNNCTPIPHGLTQQQIDQLSQSGKVRWCGITANSSANHWAVDNINYFTRWSCTSPTGINHISRLNIKPSATMPLSSWKDSLYTSFREFVGGNPTLYYTVGDYAQSSLFSMQKATYNTSQASWNIANVLSNPLNKGGVSSLDGTSSDYIMNEYYSPGWGPTANNPGSVSKIPGVSQTHVYTGIVGYPLWGKGPLGLTTIQQKIQNPAAEPNVQTCIQMNPTLFDFDANGVPHAFAASLWTGTTSTGCTLPSGQILASGTYVYRYVDNQIGWQLDLTTGMIRSSAANAVNYMWGTQIKFMTGEWGGLIEDVDISQPSPRIPKTILDCSKGNVTFSEESGNSEGLVYFLADPPPAPFHVYNTKNVYVHDIFVAYNDAHSPNPSPIPSPTVAPTAIPPVRKTLGYFDSASCQNQQFTGWACDRNSPSTPLTINFYADGPIGTGTLIGSTVANGQREVAVQNLCLGNPNHGFVSPMPASIRDGKPHAIYAYALGAIPGEVGVLLGNSPKICTRNQ